MIVTFQKAEIVENENGKFLHLELWAFVSGTRVIIQNTFPATANFDQLELAHAETDTLALLQNTAKQNDADHSNQRKESE
ncbi:MAG: hypothetical protein JWR12_1847 [Mucilaginibacter sp.]|nr:hypothetical protein [Mucilaginibacter sp.]